MGGGTNISVELQKYPLKPLRPYHFKPLNRSYGF